MEELFDIIELLNESMEDEDWDLVKLAKEKLEEMYNSTLDLDDFFESED
jgi:hypothetical protein